MSGSIATRAPLLPSIRRRRSRARRPPTLDVFIQLAAPRRGVPHSRSLKQWANAAYSDAFPQVRASDVQRLSLTIRVVGARESRTLNRTWRSKDKPTNVLSFPSGSLDVSADRGSVPGWILDGALHLGDLAVCAPVVAREARMQSKPMQAHWAHMVVHGVLHLLGYDHEIDPEARAMEARETRILSRFGISDPYFAYG